MDPDANYREQELIYLRIKAGTAHAGDHGRLKALVAALRGWVANGGFKPRGYVGPAWKPSRTATGGKPVQCAECGRKLSEPSPHLRPRTNRRCMFPDYVEAHTGKALRRS